MADRSNVFERAHVFMARMMHDRMSRTVTYVRGTARCQVRAAMGTTEHEVDDGGFALTHIESRDFIVDADRLVLNGQKVTPQAGDEIHDLIGSTTYIYEVMPFGARDHCYELDGYKRLLRIHTKETDSLA